MRLDSKNTYMILDSMPFIRDARRQNWVFSTAEKKWVKFGTDDWDAKHPTQDNWFADNFENLPELPS